MVRAAVTRTVKTNLNRSDGLRPTERWGVLGEPGAPPLAFRECGVQRYIECTRTREGETRNMAEHVTREDVRGIAEYVRIGLREDELDQMTADLNAIIDSLAPITEYDLEGVEPTFHPIGGLSNVMRKDVEEAGLLRETALGNAAKQQDGAFLIPSILGAKKADGQQEPEAGADEAVGCAGECAGTAGSECLETAAAEDAKGEGAR